MRPRRVIGCMTGSSLDGLDAALVEIDGNGLQMQARTIRVATRPLGELSERLRRVADQSPVTAGEIAALMRDFALLHAEHVLALLNGERADLIAVHGQTVYHSPPWSWQLFAAAPLVHAVQIPVVFDLRAADLAAGGQGAPMTPIADFILFQDARERRAVVNLGGFSNYTSLPAGPRDRPAELAARIHGADICACNQLLNAISRRAFHEPFDADGRRAAASTAPPALRESLSELLAGQAQSGRSLGTGDECLAWVDRNLERARGDELLRCACEAIAGRIGLALRGEVDRVILAGGGARNTTLAELIARACGAPVELSDALGVTCESREAIEMAVLGALAQDRAQIMLPQITYTRNTAALAGVWAYP